MDVPPPPHYYPGNAQDKSVVVLAIPRFSPVSGSNSSLYGLLCGQDMQLGTSEF